MHYIILEGPEGTREVQAGKAYKLKPGEKITGTRKDESVPDMVETDPARILLASMEQELHTEDGYRLGDWVGWIAKPVALLLGKQDCMSCEARKATLNATTVLMKKHGDIEAKKIVKGLLKRSLKEEPEVILKELKEHLNRG